MSKTDTVKKKYQTLKLVALETTDIGIKRPKKKFLIDFSIWIRSLMQNWRQGTIACKGRSDVKCSTKKPWKQKGTGRARAGSAASPLWRGGGVTFGPQARVRKLRINQKQKKNVLQQLLFGFLEKNRVSSVNWVLKEDKPKTAQAFAMLKEVGLVDKKIILFVSSDDALIYASFSNIPKVRLLFFDQQNAFDLANSDYWIFLKKDENSFKEMVLKWH